jgi:hypothetical protein
MTFYLCQDRVTESRFILPPETSEILDRIHKINNFQTSDVRQFKSVQDSNPETWETNNVSPVIFTSWPV